MNGVNSLEPIRLEIKYKPVVAYNRKKTLWYTKSKGILFITQDLTDKLPWIDGDRIAVDWHPAPYNKFVLRSATPKDNGTVRYTTNKCKSSKSGRVGGGSIHCKDLIITIMACLMKSGYKKQDIEDGMEFDGALWLDDSIIFTPKEEPK